MRNKKSEREQLVPIWPARRDAAACAPARLGHPTQGVRYRPAPRLAKKGAPGAFFNARRPFGFKSLRGSKREKSEWYMKHHSDYLARPEGFEPPSFGIGIHCDIQLRHGRKYIILNCTDHYTTKKGQCPHEKMRFYQFSLLRRGKVW